MVLTSMACASATVVGPGAAAIQPQSGLAEEAEQPPDQPSVTVKAASPTDVRFAADGQDGTAVKSVIVPVPRVRRPTVRRTMVHQGMLIGAAIGALIGAASGDRQDRANAASPGSCDTLACGNNTLGGALIVGALGLGAGAAAGAIVASF
jgi:hypothetical protein